jgi:hypothetical protein
MKKKVKTLGIIIGLLVLLTIIFLIFNSGITGRATGESPKGGENYCGSIRNSNCNRENSLELCMSLYGTNAVSESEAMGCFDVWLRGNEEESFNELKECADKYRVGELTMEDYRECLRVWNFNEIELPIRAPEINEIGNLFLGYYFDGIKGDKIEIFDKNGNVFVYYVYENYWEEESDKIFSNFPREFDIVTGYTFERGNIRRINIFGKVNGKNKIMIYNGEEWFDRSDEIFTNEERGLPRNFEVEFSFYNAYEDEIWVFGEKKWYVNVFGEGWIDKSEEIGRSLPLDKIPKVAYNFPSESGGRIHLFYGDAFYIYNPYSKTWQDGTNILEDIGLPGTPDIGYYDKYNEKVILFYNDEVYSYKPGSNSFNRDKSYLKYFEGLENLPSSEEINELVDYSYWSFYGDIETIENEDGIFLGRDSMESDWENCEDREKRIICFYNDGEGYSDCKISIEKNLIRYMEREKCGNREEEYFGALKGELSWEINSLSEIKQESYPHETIKNNFDFRKGEKRVGDVNGNGILDLNDKVEIERVVNQGEVVEDCSYDVNLDGKVNYKDYELLELLINGDYSSDFKCGEGDKVLVGVLNNLRGIKICEEPYEKNCIA